MLNKKHLSYFKKFKNARFNEPMSKHTTLGIGGKVQIFIDVKLKSQLIKIYNYCQQNKLNFMVIGGGSNLLVNDSDQDLIIIKNSFTEINSKKQTITCGSGVILNNLVDYANNHGLAGLESLAGIPGTVGGAVYGNAGAYGQSISDHLVSVNILRDGVIEKIAKSKCGFKYRYSKFKQHKPLILEIEFHLQKSNPEDLRGKSAEIRSIRNKKYPPSLKCPGSFYKNILASELDKETLSKIPADKIVYGKIPAGYLLEEVGSKGSKLGKIEVADYHANLFMNKGGGTAQDFYALADSCNQKVYKKFGIKLEPEVQLIGFKK